MTQPDTTDLAVQQHFVTFYSPGTFMAEQTTKPISAWDEETALAMATTINERYGATPYGFRFSTRGRRADELDSRTIATGPMHFIDGLVETVEQVRRRPDPRERTLLSNMEGNGYDRIIRAKPDAKGWSWCQPFGSEDVNHER